MRVTLSPYLNFNGQCRQALTLYQDCVNKAVVHLAAQSSATQLDSTSLDQLRATLTQSF